MIDPLDSTKATMSTIRSIVSFIPPFNTLGNLAAIDCYATIYGQKLYQKTYQDQLKVNQLCGDVLSDNKPLNIDKLFRTDSNDS
jgi:hypothetical protein